VWRAIDWAQSGSKALIAARRFDLDNEPMRSLGDLEAYAEGASAGLIARRGAGPRRWTRYRLR
jgi:phytoene/squalene synthetase